MILRDNRHPRGIDLGPARPINDPSSRDSISALSMAQAVPPKLRPPACLTLVDVADLLQLSERTIHRLIQSGQLPSVHVGRSVRIRPSVLEAFLASSERRGDAAS